MNTPTASSAHHLPSSQTLHLANLYRRRLDSMEISNLWLMTGVAAQFLPLLDRLSCWCVSTATWAPTPAPLLPAIADAITITCFFLGCLILFRAPRARR